MPTKTRTKTTYRYIYLFSQDGAVKRVKSDRYDAMTGPEAWLHGAGLGLELGYGYPSGVTEKVIEESSLAADDKPGVLPVSRECWDLALQDGIAFEAKDGRPYVMMAQNDIEVVRIPVIIQED